MGRGGGAGAAAGGAAADAGVPGSWVQQRAGRLPMLVGGAALAGAGLVLAAVAPTAAAGYAGFALAGVGLAYSFPVALELAGQAGQSGQYGGEREIGFVTTIAYAGFLAGPPMIGGVAQLAGLPVSFLAVAVLAVVIAPSAVLARRAQERERASNLLLVRNSDPA